MERIDDYDRARERHAAGDSTPAEALDEGSFLAALKPCVRDPARDISDFVFGHQSIIPAAGALTIAKPCARCRSASSGRDRHGFAVSLTPPRQRG